LFLHKYDSKKQVVDTVAKLVDIDFKFLTVNGGIDSFCFFLLPDNSAISANTRY
jgi:hypothetical protein